MVDHRRRRAAVEERQLGAVEEGHREVGVEKAPIIEPDQQRAGRLPANPAEREEVGKRHPDRRLAIEGQTQLDLGPEGRIEPQLEGGHRALALDGQ